MISNIRLTRMALDIKVIELARAIKVSPSLVSQIETGKLRGSKETREKIAKVLRVPVKQLFGY